MCLYVCPQKLEGDISQLKDSLTTAKSQQINTEAKLLETVGPPDAVCRLFIMACVGELASSLSVPCATKDYIGSFEVPARSFLSQRNELEAYQRDFQDKVN